VRTQISVAYKSQVTFFNNIQVKLSKLKSNVIWTLYGVVSVIGGSSSLLPSLSCTRIFVQAINSVVPEAGNGNA
jgi:hypothetical protein